MTKKSSRIKPVVVFDKSFAEGTRSYALQSVANYYTIAVTSSFYYETFTTLDKSRRTVFSGFPEFRRIHSPKLYDFERKTGMPVESVHAVPLNVNPDVVSGNRVLTVDEQRIVTDFEVQFVRPKVQEFKNVMDKGLDGFSASEIKSVRGDLSGFKQLCCRLLDVDFIRQTADRRNLQFASLLDEKWLTFRCLQAELLNSLTHLYFYPNAAQRRLDVDLEHDVHDVDYLALGLHAGCFATNESRRDVRKLGWKFKFLLPEGKLIQSESRNGKSHIVVS